MLRVFFLTSLVCCVVSPIAGHAADNTAWEPVIQTGHSRAITCVALSDDGRYLLTGSHDKTAILWDAATGRQLRTLSGHIREVISVALSRDGRYALTGSPDRSAILWDAQSGQKLRTFGLPEPIGLYRPNLSAVAMTADASRVLIASYGPAILWDARTGEKLREYDGHGGIVRCMALSADGRRFITGAIDRKAIVWDVETGEKIREFSGGDDDSAGRVYSVAISGDGQRVLIGTGREAMLWDTDSGRKLYTFVKKSFYESRVALSRDGRVALTRSDTPDAALHDADTGQELHKLRTDDLSRVDGFMSHFVNGVFSADGRHVITASHNAVAVRWDVRTGRRLVTYGGSMDFLHSLQISDDGRVAVSSTDTRTQVLWDTRTARNIQTFDGHSGQVHRLRLTPDSRRLITGGSDDDTAILWDVESGKPLKSFNGHRDSILAMTLSADSRRLLTSSSDKSAILWDMETGRSLQTFADHTVTVWKVDLSVDGRFALTTAPRKATLWDTETGRNIRSFEGHRSQINSARLSPNGKLVATASGDKTVALWNTQTGEMLHRLEVNPIVTNDVAFSPDSRQLLTRSSSQLRRSVGEAALWDTASGKKLRTMDEFWWFIVQAKWRDEGQRRVITPSLDNSIRIRDANTGTELAALYRFNAGEDWLAITPDGKFDGSDGFERFIGYRVAGTVNLVPADEYRRRFHRPGLLDNVWNGVE